MNDDQLQDRLRTADPAAGLDPLPVMRRTALLDRAASGTARAPRRSRLAVALGGLVAAAAVAGVVVLLLPRPDGPTGPVVTLRAAGTDPTSLCAPLADFAVQGLRTSDLALLGRVESVSGETVEIVPLEVYRGAAMRLVRLRADAGGGGALDGPVLHDGQQVLIAATDGSVAACGLSAVQSPELQRYYDRAFG